MCGFDATGYLYLDSDDRDNKPNPDVVDVTFPVDFKGNRVEHIALRSYDFVVQFDNINERNQTAYIDDGGTTYPVTITTRTYDIFQLRSELITELDLLGLGGWAITLFEGKFQIVAPVPVRWITNPVKPQGRDWADMVGIIKDVPLSLFHNGGLADIVYTNKIYITSQDISQFKTYSDESSSRRITSALGVVYVNSNLSLGNERIPISPETVIGHHATRPIDFPKWINHRDMSDIGVIRIILLDDRGETIPESQKGNLRWSLEIMMR